MKSQTRHIFWIAAVLCIVVTACSTKKNTATNRAWHSFTTRYNVFFNGKEAYKTGFETKENGNRDNYTELLPYFYVGNRSSQTTGSSNFATAIEKCEKAIQLHSIKRKPALSGGKKLSPKEKAYRSRKEFNPFLKNAWLLMGKAQFQKGEFLEAASTFSYITRLYAAEPMVATEARVWLARCYSQLEWYYDAEEALSKVPSDSLPSRISRERDRSMADLLLSQGHLKEAVPYLTRAAKHEEGHLQKARIYFLLGQVQQQNGNANDAYQAYKKCVSQNPPYELAFNARIRQTEVLAAGEQGKKMVKRLRKMSRSAKNKEYLDQIFYAMGNIFMVQQDTANAISAYEKGRKESTRNGIEKGVLLLRLAEVYWDKGRYDLAQSCYADAIGIINKDYEGYEEITRRSKVLDQLVPHTSAIYLQDSLLTLAAMNESDRNAAIDRVIEALKKKEEEERKAREDSLAEADRQKGGAGYNPNNNRNPQNNQQNEEGQEWYFYNTVRVTQGKQEFKKRWGTRKNEDNWRRSNRTVLSDMNTEEIDYEKQDSIAAAEAIADTAQQVDPEQALQDSLQNDPHQREYYLAQIPLTDEAKAESHKIIQESLYQAGIIEKDELEDFPLAAKTLTRLYTDYPECEQLEDTYYQLFLMYSRWRKKSEADRCRDLLAAHFPEGAYARMITDPDFERNAMFGRQMEDSLYMATYMAYRNRDKQAVNQNFDISTQKYPKGANRPKFIFVHALNNIGTLETQEVIAELRDLVKEFPESDVSEMAGLIVKGLESGRQIGDPHYNLGSLWERRDLEADSAANLLAKQKELSSEREIPFVCLIAYPTDSLDDDQLLYDIAHFNFSGFMVRNFDLNVERDPQLTQFRISGFNNFDEAHVYAQKLFSEPALSAKLKNTRVLLISSKNLELLGVGYSYNDYQKFYEKTFAPLKINPALPLDSNDGNVEYYYEDEFSDEELKEMEEGESEETEDDDSGEWY